MTGTVELSRELHHDAVRVARVNLAAGRVEIGDSADGGTHAFLEADDRHPDAADYLSRTTFEVRGDELVLDPPRTDHRPPALHLRIEAPVALELRVSTGSADITAGTTIGSARLATGSGDIRLGRVEGALDAKAGRGDVTVTSVREAVSITTGSGDIEIGTHEQVAACSTGSGDVRISEAVGPVKVKVGSGDITVERVRNHSVATSGSGDVRVESADGPSVVAESARGDVHVGVPAGTRTYLDLKTVTGDIRCDLDPSDKPAEGERTLALRARTVSGDITVIRV
ncbi:MAG TPA: DUF4097 family beta strand repeat-containing protein [Kribbellaceae bacterium]|jgi:DUF4097 and DUF4098 domain-containing protein YvlB